MNKSTKTRMFRRSGLTLSSLLLAASFSLNSIAQDSVGDDSTILYPASYFEEFSPINAQDMLDRIPGIGSATGGNGGFGRGGGGGGNGGRGFGSGSGGNQILINGKRTAGKNNQTSAQLNRITAEQVDYIELIRGTSGDLDVRGSGQVINVVLFEELSSSSITYEINSDRYADHKMQPGGSVSYSGKSGALSYVLSGVAEPRYDHRVSKESSILGDFSPNDTVREDRIRKQTSYNFSTNLDYEISANSSARFNALYSENDNPTTVLRTTTDLTVTPSLASVDREDIPGQQYNWEIGGDYEYLSNAGNRFKVLFIANENNRDNIRETFDVAADGSETKDLFLATSSVTTERILRGSYTMDLFDGQNIEFGAEGAQTILDSKLSLGLIEEGGIASPAFGGLVPQQVSNANSSVEEIRFEPFIIHNWVINPKMSLESTLLYETSEITQSGDISNTRDFSFVKPKVDFRYDVTPTLQLRTSLEKVVLQLRFSDFVADSDSQDNDANVAVGNADLRQEWLWKYDINADLRLPDDVGVIGANFYYHEHYDRIARIDVSTSEDVLQSANGNIGDGTVIGLNLNASIRMRMIDMPNLLITSNFNVQDSKIQDSFLDIERRFTRQNRGRLSLGFRHDLPAWNMNYGASWNNRFDGNMLRYDIDDIEVYSGDPMLNVFVEFIAFGGTTFRFDARNASDNLQCRERRRYDGRITAGIIEEIENQCSGYGRVLSLKVSGNF